MAARTWFTTTIYPDVPREDLAILNRAARNGWDERGPSRIELMALRMTYKPGMSENDLIAAVQGED